MIFDAFKRLFRQTDKQTDVQNNESSVPAEIQKDSLQLGFAAGYTGRSIHDINSSLNRIETMMPSKDWLVIELEKQSKQLEEGSQRRFQATIEALGSLRFLSGQAPEPLKTQLLDKIEVIESRYAPSGRMKELIQLVKLAGEASFKDFAKKMDLSDSGFRTMVMMTLPRTNEIEKFNKGGKERWLRYKRPDAQTDASIDQDQTNEQSNT